MYSASEPSIDGSPYISVVQDGMVAPTLDDQSNCTVSDEPVQHVTDLAKDESPILDAWTVKADSQNIPQDPLINSITDMTRRVDGLLRRNRMSMWLLTYIAVVTTWPVVGSALIVFAKRRLKSGVLKELFRSK